MMNDEELKEQVIEAIKTVYDPEIPVDVWELGLIYRIDILPINNVQVDMSLTAPGCPSAQEIPVEVEEAIRGVSGVNEVVVNVVWEPAWNQEMMSEEARLELGFM